jgi:asparagine synthase (glutamine-hydrolysing)
MCGIAGVVGHADPARAAAHVAAMLACLERRGPDAEGLHTWPEAVFGHRRLSIFDLSDAGRQPMLSADGEVGVVFNGAIYNFRALRAGLEAEGCRFRTGTDTEVLLHGYRVWGMPAMLDRLRGMFAIGLWDARQRKLWLWRDRMGVKPLLYAERNGMLAFASTARALHRAGFSAGVDPDGVMEYLEYGWVSDARSIYMGIRKLPAGELLEWQAGQIRGPQPYWTLPRPEEEAECASNSCATGPSFADAVAGTERLFLESVRLRLDADVPVGALLSGGVDSSLVCWAIAELGANIRAFTVQTDGAADETPDAVRTARELGIAHEVIPVRAGQAPPLDDLVDAYGEPFSTASALGMLQVSQAVKRSATVLLTGDGGDDVFLGYPEHRNFFRAQNLARTWPAALIGFGAAAAGLLPARGAAKRARNFLAYAARGLPAIPRAHNGVRQYMDRNALGPRLRGRAMANHNLPAQAGGGASVLADFLDYDRRTRFTGEYMTKVDGATMYYGIEARSPFLDHKIWDFAARLPLELRLRNGELKAILRELARQRLGERVAAGAKRGFTIPVEQWLLKDWRPLVDALLDRSILLRDGWLEAEAMRTWWRQSLHSGAAPVHFWRLLVLENWLEKEINTAACR